MTVNLPTERDLEDAIFSATKTALSALFAEHPEHFYYISLITTGEAHPPFISAWSTEALARAASKWPGGDVLQFKWSYADSPYMCFGEKYFTEVNELFSLRPPLNHSCTPLEWKAEYALRLRAMEGAMAQLDREGLFGISEARLHVVVNVEVMPPDSTNTVRAKRLNPQGALTAWLAETAEQ